MSLAFNSPDVMASLRNSLDNPVKAYASAMVSSNLSAIGTNCSELQTRQFSNHIMVLGNFW
jgi:hypothetical protein